MIRPTYLTLWEVSGSAQRPSGNGTAPTAYPFCHYPRRKTRQWGTLWDKVDATGESCWPFVGGRFSTGYGAYTVDGKARKAHRIAYEAIHGTTESRVLHSCDNPPCCNPAHLFAGSMSDNSRDMVAKGRGPRGVEPRLTDAQVRLIRSLARLGWKQARIAELVGCHWVHVSNIVRGKRRADVLDREQEAVA